MRTFSTLNHGPNNAMSFLCMFLAVCCEPFCKCDTLLTSTLLTNIVATAAFFFVGLGNGRIGRVLAAAG